MKTVLAQEATLGRLNATDVKLPKAAGL